MNTVPCLICGRTGHTSSDCRSDEALYLSNGETSRQYSPPARFCTKCGHQIDGAKLASTNNSWCRSCQNEYKRQWNLKNKEKRRAEKAKLAKGRAAELKPYREPPPEYNAFSLDWLMHWDGQAKL